MTTDVLTGDALVALDETPLAGAIDWLKATHSAVVVVRDRAGVIVGHWALTAFWHAEGAWVAPDHQGKGVVLGRLLEAMGTRVQEMGASAVLCQCDDPTVQRLLQKLGAEVVPGHMWRVPM